MYIAKISMEATTPLPLQEQHVLLIIIVELYTTLLVTILAISCVQKTSLRKHVKVLLVPLVSTQKMVR